MQIPAWQLSPAGTPGLRFAPTAFWEASGARVLQLQYPGSGVRACHQTRFPQITGFVVRSYQCFHLRRCAATADRSERHAWIAIHPPKRGPARSSELSTLVSCPWTETHQRRPGG